MANSGPDTQGSQFFIITGDQGVALPPLYSLFGQVDTDGLTVVSEMDARGSLDGSGTPASEVRLISVEIHTA
jgi:cyclophilin family peptidyl-prolyl cis-trans isomerase